jgi:hypothetical protein
MKRLLAIVALATAVLPMAAHAQQEDSRPTYGAGRGDETRAREAVRRGAQAPLSRVIANIAARAIGTK